MNRIVRNSGFYLLIVLVVIGIVYSISNQNDQKVELSYDKFRQAVVSNSVTEVTVQFDGYTYVVNGVHASLGGQNTSAFFTYAPIGERVFDLLDANNTEYNMKKMEQPSAWITVLTTIIPFVIILVLFFF